MERLLEGKNMIITGSSRGIGWAVLERAAASEANIWACARTEDERFEEKLRTIAEKYQVWIEPLYFDLQDEAAVKAAVKHIASEKKPVDILVNNAGMAYSALMQMTPLDQLKEVFQVNYFSQILMIQLISKLMMRRKSGTMINIASVGGIEANPGYLAYGSSKASLIWATKCIAKELAPYGIRVNAVAPGLTDTQMGHYKSEEEMRKVIDRTAMQRMAKPEEIADAVMYLASDYSSYITGHILTVDGGRL